MPIINTQEGLINLIKRYVTPYGYNGVTIQPSTTYHVGGGNPQVSQFFAFLGDSQESYTTNTMNNHGQYAAAMFFVHSYQDSVPAYSASYSNDMVLIFASNSTDVFPDDIAVSFMEYPGEHRTHITTFTNRSNKTITMRAMTARAGRYSGPGGSDYKMGYSYGASDRTLQPSEEVGWFTLDTVCFAFSNYSEYPIIYIQPRENLPKTTKDANFLAFMRDLGAAIKSRAGMLPKCTDSELKAICHGILDGHRYGGGSIEVYDMPYMLFGENSAYSNHGVYSTAFVGFHAHIDGSSDWSGCDDIVAGYHGGGNFGVTANDIQVTLYEDTLGRKYIRSTNLTSRNITMQTMYCRSNSSFSYGLIMQGASRVIYANGGHDDFGPLLDDWISDVVDNTPSLAAQQYASTIRSLDGETVTPSVVIPTINSNLGDYLTDIANAIRDKKGITPHEGNEINAQDFASQIASIPVPEGGDE